MENKYLIIVYDWDAIGESIAFSFNTDHCDIKQIKEYLLSKAMVKNFKHATIMVVESDNNVPKVIHYWSQELLSS